MAKTKGLRDRIRLTVQELRKFYYATHKEEIRDVIYAFGGKPTESIGPFAEYNLRSRHCPQ